MASTGRDNKTYHVVPRFDMAAKGGPLFLGALFQNLEFRRPALNRLQPVEVRDELKYPSVPQTGFSETRSKIREGKFEAWVKTLTEHISGSAAMSGSSDDEETVACEEIVTTYFDPDDTYLDDTLAVKPIQDYLEGHRGWTADLYMITGLKVANKLEYNKSNASKGEASGHIDAKDPQTGIGGGVSARVGEENKHHLEFVVADVVVGYRVNKYRCVRRLGFSRKDRKVKDDGVLEGQMMGDVENKAEQPYVQFEELPIPEETIGSDEVVDGNSGERWVVKKS